VPGEPQAQAPTAEELRLQVLGLGERSFRKTWYPELQERLAELERFRTLLDHALEGILLVDLEGRRIVDANRTALELLRQSREALLGCSLEAIVPAEILERLAREGATEVSAEQWPTANPDLTLEASQSHAVLDERPYAVLLLRDVTQRRQLERQAMTAQKLESLGRLAGGIAHDFNNLLGAIIGTVELVRTELEPNSPASLDLADVLEATQRATQLVGRLMAFGRHGSGTPTVLDLVALTRDLQRLLLRLVGEHARLTVDLPDGPVWIRAEATAVEQILINLVSNARDAVPQGGHVAVGISLTTERCARCCAVGECETAPCAVVTVADDGVGMDEATQQRIFEPFFTTKPVGKGTGLGLAVVYGIVKQSGGTIELQSAPGAGARFRLCFPGQPAPSVLPPAPQREQPQGMGRGQLILLVEDEPLLRTTVSRILRQAGFQVLTAEDAEEAAFRAKRAPHQPELLLCDVRLPDGSGPDVLEELRGKWPTLRCLFISGHTADDELAAATSAVALLPKPFTSAELLARVEAVLTPPLAK